MQQPPPSQPSESSHVNLPQRFEPPPFDREEHAKAGAQSMPLGERRVLADGWTCIGRGMDRSPAITKGLGCPSILPDITQQQLRQEYDTLLPKWKSSDHRQQRSMLLARQVPQDGWQITNAVCLGTGSFSCDYKYGRRTRNLTQICAFIDTVEQLQTSSPETIQLYVQDPLYTQTDVDLLVALGIHVVRIPLIVGCDAHDRFEGPDACDYLNSSSFLCELSIERDQRMLKLFLENNVKLLVGSLPFWKDEDIGTDWISDLNWLFDRFSGYHEQVELLTAKHDVTVLPWSENADDVLGLSLCSIKRKSHENSQQGSAASSGPSASYELRKQR